MKVVDGLDFSNQRGVNVANPVAGTDVASRTYVDSVAVPGVGSQITGSVSLTAVNSFYSVNFTAGLGTQSIVLPSAPAQGSQVQLFRVDTNSYTSFCAVSAGGTDVMQAGAFTLPTGMGVTFLYAGTTWYLTDTSLSGLSGVLGATSNAAFPPSVMARDSFGRSQVSTPSVAADIANKAYADTKLDYLGAWNSAAAYAVNDVVSYNGVTYVCIDPVPAGAASTVIGAQTFTTDSGASQNMTLPAGAAVGDVLVWLVETVTTVATTPAVVGTLIDSATTNFTGGNKVNGAFSIYTLIASDITNGYVTLPVQTSPIKITSEFICFRNVFSNATHGKTATSTTAPITPGVASYVVSMVGYALAGGSPQTISCTGVSLLTQATALNPNNLANNTGSAIAYDVLAAGTSTARVFTTPSSTIAHTFSQALQSSGGTNPTPDTDTTDWAPLGTIPLYYEELALATLTTASGVAGQIKGSTTSKLDGTSAYATASGLWTCPADGVYEVNLLASIASGAASTRNLWTFATGTLNSGTIFARDDKPSSVASSATSLTAQKYFAAGATVYAAVQCTATTVTSLSGQISFRRVQ